MKCLVRILSVFVSVFLLLAGCRNGESTVPSETRSNQRNLLTASAQNSSVTTGRIRISVGDQTFFAGLYGNESAQAFAQRLPLTLTMSELNGNEKYDYLQDDLPSDDSCPLTIHAGDLMLYGSDCLVLFYKDFPTSYHYTSLGRIEHPQGLADVLGEGNVTVTFSLEKP